MFPHGQAVFRDRARRVPDPYNPARTVPADIDDNPETIEVPDSWVADSSSYMVGDGIRTQVVTAKSLYCSDPDVDVQIGDRIRVEGYTYWVRVRPAADRNPWTGWSPGVEIPLEEVRG